MASLMTQSFLLNDVNKPLIDVTGQQIQQLCRLLNQTGPQSMRKQLMVVQVRYMCTVNTLIMFFNDRQRV